MRTGNRRGNPMNDDEPKSAIEIAMAKLRASDDFKETRLSDDQKKEIAEIRTRCRAKIAELEIHHESKLRLAASLDEQEQLQKELNSEKDRLNQEMEKKVQKVRDA